MISVMMKVVKATIIRLEHGPDHVILSTDLPDAIWPFNEGLTVKFSAARDSGESYLQEHFPGLPFEVVKSRT